MTFMVKLFTDEFQLPLLLKSAVTNARLTTLHRLTVGPFPPFDHACSTSQTARSSRASIREVPHERRASVCGSAAALRSGFVPAVSLLSAPLLPLADHRQEPDNPHTRARCSIRQSVIGQFQIFQSLIVKLQAIRLVAWTAR
jgi:hypothetical protein